MRPIIKKYKALVGRPPSQDEVEQLERIARELELRDNDALWLLFIALEDYDRRYRMAPARIEKALAKAVESVRHTADKETRAAAARAIETMSEEAARISQEIATKTAGKERARWMTIMAAVCASVLFLTGAAAFYAGQETGAAATSDAAAWARSHEGRHARALAGTGSLPILVNCDGNGWRIESQNGRNVCRPAQGAGWFIP